MRMFFSVLAVVATTSIAAAQEASDRPGKASTPPGMTQRTLWDIYLSIKPTELGHVGMLAATVEAADENEAIEKAPAWSKQSGRKLLEVPAYREPAPPGPRSNPVPQQPHNPGS